ncbi:MAG: redox-regulated molecular chaperone Hsp33 [Proteobacteria bacterium]|nr:redox-regulated molecular chaperone Hsp33 [Pseudomonadota bacterium]
MDTLHRFSFSNLPIRGQWVRLHATLRAAGQYRAYPAAVSSLLGQMLATVAMVADNLKFSGAVAMQSRGNGALRRSLAECRNHTQLRGVMHLTDDASFPASRQNIDAWLGEGQLALTLLPDEETGMQPYQGLIALQNQQLGKCLEEYFERSEQLQTRLHFACDTHQADQVVTGLLLQRLPNHPNASEAECDAAEDAWETLIALAATVTETELAQLAVQTLLQRLFHEYPCVLQPAKQLEYACTCSTERTDSTLMLLGREDLAALLKEQGEISVDCEFCGNRYLYDAPAVDRLMLRLQQRDNLQGDRPLH